MKACEIAKTSAIIFTFIIIAVAVSILFVTQPAFWSKLILNENTAYIANTIGGMSALIVQSACVIALYLTLNIQRKSLHLTLEEQKVANGIQRRILDEQQKINKKQIEKMESDIKLSICANKFDQLIRKFEDKIILDKLLHRSFSDIKEEMDGDTEIFKEVLCFLSSFLRDLQYHIEDVINEEIKDKQKENLIRRIKNFMEIDFYPKVYNHIEEDWKTKYSLQQWHEKIQDLLNGYSDNQHFSENIDTHSSCFTECQQQS